MDSRFRGNEMLVSCTVLYPLCDLCICEEIRISGEGKSKYQEGSCSILVKG